LRCIDVTTGGSHGGSEEDNYGENRTGRVWRADKSMKWDLSPEDSTASVSGQEAVKKVGNSRMGVKKRLGR
jgi:hypothetical protein